ncbi:MAG: HlyD family efflux transporter periplasmic adaptor subunit [Xanthomonadales bacterium PRO6]|nr:hypothetical protein [Xanthomonadales bacterium]MCE7932385.1 HlyD family efflux transporter periplasmic adaptor subunit [Xanthomonadales bacterium PRO6]
MAWSKETIVVAEARWLPCLLLCAALGVDAAPLVSGEVYAIGAQVLRTPPSPNSPVVLRHYLADGTRVRAGDVVLRIDGGAAASSIRQFRSQRLQAQARADKEIAELEVKALDAERALRNAELALTRAELDAGIPKRFITALDHDRYQGELLRARDDLAVKHGEWRAAQSATQRRREDARLELDQLQTQIDYWQTQLDAAELRATRAGVVVHGFDPWRGNRFDEGSQSLPGNRVGEIVDAEDAPQLGVRAWVLEVDRAALQPGQAVDVRFDMLGGRSLPGRIETIAGAPTSKAEWGDGRYFEAELAVELDAQARRLLRPGASARIAPARGGVGATGSRAPTSAATARRFEGEIIARDASAIAPPEVGDVWLLALTQLLPDGTPVSAGQVVATFDGNELTRQSNEKRSSLNEKQTLLGRLALEHAERARAEAIATAEARAKLVKAQRKASQPAELYAANDYRKLVAERRLAELEMALVERREVLAARQRKAERAQIQAEADDLAAQVAEIEEGLGKLQVKAPRSGVMLHLSNHQGEKFDVGDQIFRGQAVAQIPDMERLAVRMQLPERQADEVRIDQPARIEVDGGAVPTMTGKVVAIGRVVRSRSRVVPVPVIDVEIELDALPAAARLKPGLPVRVELLRGEDA